MPSVLQHCNRNVIPKLPRFFVPNVRPLKKSTCCESAPISELSPSRYSKSVAGATPSSRELILPAMEISARHVGRFLQAVGRSLRPQTNHRHCIHRCTSMLRPLIRCLFLIRLPFASPSTALVCLAVHHSRRPSECLAVPSLRSLPSIPLTTFLR